ncbi:hypothetical protein [uncultured Algibacter sp.]|uniref:hypothetical protein n=1 Tax=uncultured Algibacter sp. TaxID=298659 RepID=UPI00261FB1F1|nr:hypothetical protein [uncultured Algibacter sp.]
MKLIKYLFFVGIISFAYACSSSSGDDDESGSGLERIPSGEIVAKELRNETLTGFSSLSGKSSSKMGDTQKWWTHVTSDFSFNDNDVCDEDDESYNSQGYAALYPNGKRYQKTSKDGSPFEVGTWQWTDSNKTALHIDNETDIVFKITYLNNGNLVFGYTASQGGCTLTTYEEFNAPFFE